MGGKTSKNSGSISRSSTSSSRRRLSRGEMLEKKMQERNLDSSAVESNSFITQNFGANNRRSTGSIRKGNNNKRNSGRIGTLDRLEDECVRIEEDLRNAMASESLQEIEGLETRIERLYTTLEMIETHAKGSQAERKETIGRRLLKFNAKIKRCKKKMLENPREENEIARVEAALEKLELRVAAFDETKDDQSYKQLQQILENHWTKLYSIDAIGDDERARKTRAIARAKTELQALDARALQNEQQRRALEKLKDITANIRNVERRIVRELKSLDELKSIEMQLDEVEEPTVFVRKSKEKSLRRIHEVLRQIESRHRSSFEFHEVTPVQDLTEQVRDFCNRWSVIDQHLDTLSGDLRPQITQTLLEVTKGIESKITTVQPPDLLTKNETGNVIQEEQEEEEQPEDRIEFESLLKQVENLQGNVDRFCGVFHGLRYRQLDEDLQNCLGKLAEMRGIEQTSKLQTEQNIRRIRQVLEDKSAKATIETDANGSHQQINALRDKLVDAKQRTESFTGAYRDQEYRDIESNIWQCRKDLFGIHDNGHNSIVLSKRQYADYIEALFEYFEEKAKAGRNSNDDDPLERLEETSVLIERIEEEIEMTCHGDQPEKIATKLRKCFANLDAVKDINLALIQDRYRKLLVKVKAVQSEFQRKMQSKETDRQLERIARLNDQLWKIAERIESFRGSKSCQDYGELDEILIRLMIELDDIRETEDDDDDQRVHLGKQETARRIRNYMRLLESKVQTSV